MPFKIWRDVFPGRAIAGGLTNEIASMTIRGKILLACLSFALVTGTLGLVGRYQQSRMAVISDGNLR